MVFAIILGLGLAQLLRGIGRLVRDRRRITIYWVTLAWVFVLVHSYRSYWDFIWSGRDNVPWDATAVLIGFLQLSLLYLLTVLILPDFSAAGHIDMRRHYFGVRSWFFGIFAGFWFLQVLTYQLYVPDSLWFGAASIVAYVYIAVSIGAAVIRNERFHAALAAVLAFVIAGDIISEVAV